jgi:2-dehydro-3-deoxygluconokinase
MTASWTSCLSAPLYIATVYSDRGYGVRPPVVFYNRANEAGAMLKAGDFNWDEIFGQGVRWFHSGGIYAALSSTTSGLIIEAMKAAQKHGVITSFDLNYRPKLWAPIGGMEQAQKTFRAIVENVDVLLGNEEDLQLGLGINRCNRGKQAGLLHNEVRRPEYLCT